MTYQIDFECHWSNDYPTQMTCGTFLVEGEDDLAPLLEIRERFLAMPQLTTYHFIVQCVSKEGNGNVFEMKSNAD